jgi:hypothetical protein
MEIYIERFADDESIGTFGRLSIYQDTLKIFDCYTVERPWLANKPFVSCIPPGAYILENHASNKYGNTYAIVGGAVGHQKNEAKEKHGGYSRYACLFHSANIFTNVSGCVGLGSNLGSLAGLWSVSNSRKTVDKFLEILKASSDTHSLVINNKFV